MLLHSVYFRFQDGPDRTPADLMADLKAWVPGVDGVEFFQVGTAAPLDREVNDRDWDASLHIGFRDLAAHDAYQVCADHLRFIETFQSSWSQVRVFDTVGE